LTDEMHRENPGTITDLLETWNRGEDEALGQLMTRVYGELRTMADRCLRDESRATIQPTSLIHEAFLRLKQGGRTDLVNRRHFFWYAGQLMRRILIEHARARNRLKRGAGVIALSLDHALEVPEEAKLDLDELLTLDRALSDLEALEPRYAKIVELRFFAGLDVVETATLLEISPTTVKREWAAARQWLAWTMGAVPLPA